MPRPRKRTRDKSGEENAKTRPPVEERAPLPKSDPGAAGSEDSGDKAPIPQSEEAIVLVKVEGGEVVDAVTSNALTRGDGEDADEAPPLSGGALVPMQAAMDAEIVTGEDAKERELSEAIAGDHIPRTTKFYNRTNDFISLDESERIVL